MNRSEGLANAGARRIFDTSPVATPTDERLMRTALEMARDRGLSQREIARELNVPLNTIKTYLAAGVRQLRDAMLTAGGQGELSMAA